MNNTTTTPRDRLINAIVTAVDAPAARRAIGELEIREPDASVRVRLSKLGADVGRALDRMSHVEFIDARGALALSRDPSGHEALKAFGLNVESPTPPPRGERPRRVWDPSAGLGRPLPRTSDRRSPEEEGLADLIAENVVRALEEREAAKASEELSKWKVRAEANEGRVGRLRAIVGAWIGASGMTRDSVRVWDRELGEALDVAKDAASWGTTEAEIQADHAATLERGAEYGPRLRGLLKAWWSPERMDTRATLRAYDPEFARALDEEADREGLECQTPGAAATRREEAAETPKDGQVGPATREALQRAQGVTFKGDDLEALQCLLAVYSAPDRAQMRADLNRFWPGLDNALDGLVDAYKRAAK